MIYVMGLVAQTPQVTSTRVNRQHHKLTLDSAATLCPDPTGAHTQATLLQTSRRHANRCGARAGGRSRQRLHESAHANHAYVACRTMG